MGRQLHNFLTTSLSSQVLRYAVSTHVARNELHGRQVNEPLAT